MPLNIHVRVNAITHGRLFGVTCIPVIRDLTNVFFSNVAQTFNVYLNGISALTELCPYIYPLNAPVLLTYPTSCPLSHRFLRF